MDIGWWHFFRFMMLLATKMENFWPKGFHGQVIYHLKHNAPLHRMKILDAKHLKSVQSMYARKGTEIHVVLPVTNVHLAAISADSASG